MSYIFTKNRSKYFVLFILLMQGTLLFAQDYLPAKPKLETSVYDNAQMMSAAESKSLKQKLIRYNDTTSTQLVVITVNTLQGNGIAIYATELAHKWGIGQADKDNGVLVLVAKEERKVTIRTGYGMEHILTDALSKRIIENVITPEFKQGDFYAGLDKGTTVIMQIMSGEYQGEPVRDGQGEGFPPILFLILFIVIIMVLSRNRRGGGKNNRGNKGGGFSLLDAIILSNAGRGGFGGGSFGGGSSSGGFGSGGFGGGFGGGGFGGGGASGGW